MRTNVAGSSLACIVLNTSSRRSVALEGGQSTDANTPPVFSFRTTAAAVEPSTVSAIASTIGAASTSLSTSSATTRSAPNRCASSVWLLKTPAIPRADRSFSRLHGRTTDVPDCAEDENRRVRNGSKCQVRQLHSRRRDGRQSGGLGEIQTRWDVGKFVRFDDAQRRVRAASLTKDRVADRERVDACADVSDRPRNINAQDGGEREGEPVLHSARTNFQIDRVDAGGARLYEHVAMHERGVWTLLVSKLFGSTVSMNHCCLHRGSFARDARCVQTFTARCFNTASAVTPAE